MLKNPKVRLFNELDSIVIEVEDEGTAIKVDITEKVLSLISESNKDKLKELLDNCNEDNRHEEIN